MEENILSASGRISRSSFWSRWLIVFIMNIGLSAMQAAARDQGVIILTALISLVLGVFMLIQTIKRMHDVGKSGWFSIIPVYNLILALTDGEPGMNQYGSDPKNRSSICPKCHAINTSEALVCETCSTELVPSGPQVTTGSGDIYILVFLAYGVFNALISFLIERLVPEWYSSSFRYVMISLNIIWACGPILLALAIREENKRTIGLIIGIVWAAYVLLRNLQWMFES